MSPIRTWPAEQLGTHLNWPFPIDLAYQPFIELRTGRLVGVEALARFTAGPTAKVVALAERLSRAAAIDLDVLGQVLPCLQGADAPDVPVHVNVSARSLATPRFTASVRQLLEDHTPAPGRLVFEVTETAPMAGRDAMLRFASTVRDAGAMLAVDDVPGGHDRLMTMAILRPEVVKLDGDTLQRSCDDAGERLRLEAAVALAEEYGSVLVAEGIEEPFHVEMAMRLGAEIGQGYGLGVPLRCPLEDVRPYQRHAA